jgi:V/A-type H+/Na+-transporting ATPase subunit E
MSLHAILQAIRDSGEARVCEIESRACAQAQEVLADARTVAESIREKAFADTVDPANRERARLIHRARLEALQTLGEAREALVDSALEQCRGRLAGIRREPYYTEVLRCLIRETLDELWRSEGELSSGRTTCLEADPRDQKILEMLLDQMDLHLPVSYVLECWGGLIAKREDGRISVINTLEARLERATPYLRRFLAAVFEDQQPDLKDTLAFAGKHAF